MNFYLFLSIKKRHQLHQCS